MMNKNDTLLYWNAAKLPLPDAVLEAAAAHLKRLGSQPTHVILPLGGEYPATVSGLTVETHLTVNKNHMKVYAEGAE